MLSSFNSAELNVLKHWLQQTTVRLQTVDTLSAWTVAKKNKKLGFVIPKEIAYALLLSVLGGAVTAYNQLQTVDQRLQTIESEINVLIR